MVGVQSLVAVHMHSTLFSQSRFVMLLIQIELVPYRFTRLRDKTENIESGTVSELNKRLAVHILSILFDRVFESGFSP